MQTGEEEGIMKFGINLLSQHPVARKQADLYDEMIEQAELAEEMGFHSVFVNEHHPFNDPSVLWLQPLPAIAAIAARTNTISVGTNVLILPLYHPVKVAEDVAFINEGARGRVILGVGIGYLEHEFAVFGVDMRSRASRVQEQIEIIRALWNSDGVSFVGDHFVLDDVSLAVESMEYSPAPIWIGAEVERSVRRAARLGDAWLPADTASIAVLEAQYVDYRDELVSAGKSWSETDRPLMRETFCAEDGDYAEQRLAPHVLEKYQQYWQMGAPQLTAEFPNGEFEFSTLKKGRFIVGNPDDCIRQIQHHVSRLGTTQMIFRIQKPGITHAETLDAIRLLGKNVISVF